MKQYFLENVKSCEQQPFLPCMLIVQARMSSSRLPGKVLMPILGKPLLFYLVERLRRVTQADGIVIATSNEKEDDHIHHFCDQEGVHVVRESLHDVLSRMYAASSSFGLECFVRITADCPLIDPLLIDKALFCFKQNYEQLDYLSNTQKRTFPRGMDFEIVRHRAIEQSYFEADSAYEREHVTPYITKHPELFRLANFEQKVDQSTLRLTVDEPADFTLVTKLFEELYPKNPDFGLADITALLQKHPDWVEINRNVAQKN